MDPMSLCSLKPYQSMMQNSLWHFDAYPELPDLQPYGQIELGTFNGPGVVRTIHLTLNMVESDTRKGLLRGVFLVVKYDGQDFASVYAPVGDFFCDSFASESIPFASFTMAKRPTNSLYCYLPMPFNTKIEVSLVNTTDKKVWGYGYVTAERIPEWKPDLGYFHATWLDKTLNLPEDLVPLLNTQGTGHFLGCHLTAESSCTHFAENQGICEGNDEFYVDGSEEPKINYLGTEDFFGFSWNWRSLWFDNYSGTTYLSDSDGITRLACYRFLLNDPVRFSESLKAQINYRNEVNNGPLLKAKEEGSGQVRFGIVTYWYQNAPVDANSV